MTPPRPSVQATARGARTALAALLFALLAGWIGGSVAQGRGAPVRESAVKAAYLVQFLGYVQWPAEALPPGRPLVIGVAGSDAVAAELQAIAPGRRIDGRPLAVRPVAGVDDLAGLHVLFVGRSAETRRYAELTRQQPVLLVTESSLDAGGMLNFVAVDGRIRFEAALAPAHQAGIKLGSRLLAVAERVVQP